MTINPLLLDGKEWPYLTTNLAISSRYSVDGSMDASVSAVFTPTRIDENGEVAQLPDQRIVLFRGSLSELKDQHEIKAMLAIKTALEELIASKLGQ